MEGRHESGLGLEDIAAPGTRILDADRRGTPPRGGSNGGWAAYRDNSGTSVSIHVGDNVHITFLSLFIYIGYVFTNHVMD